jgi:Spy/CpxP family protein refolding chaperone
VKRRLAMRRLCIVLALVAPWVCGKLHAQVKREPLAERIQDLQLSDEQEARIADIRKECGTKILAASKELHEIVKEEEEKVRAVLTPEQKNKLEGLKEERQERRAEGLAERVAHFKELDLTGAEMAKMSEFRKEYRPRMVKAMEELKGTLSAEQRKVREEALTAGKKRKEVLASLNLTDQQKQKVEAVGKEVATLFREKIAKIADVLDEGQKEKLQELKGERREHVRDRWAHRIANLEGLNLTDEQKSKIAEIRKEYRPRVHEAGNRLRAAVRQELHMITAAIKG